MTPTEKWLKNVFILKFKLLKGTDLRYFKYHLIYYCILKLSSIIVLELFSLFLWLVESSFEASYQDKEKGQENGFKDQQNDENNQFSFFLLIS